MNHFGTGILMFSSVLALVGAAHASPPVAHYEQYMVGQFQSIATDGNQNLYITYAGDQIWKYTVSTGVWYRYPGNARTIAVGQNGGVWVINSAGRIYEWSNGGYWMQAGGWSNPVNGSIAAHSYGDAWVLGVSPNYQTIYYSAGQMPPVHDTDWQYYFRQTDKLAQLSSTSYSVNCFGQGILTGFDNNGNIWIPVYVGYMTWQRPWWYYNLQLSRLDASGLTTYRYQSYQSVALFMLRGSSTVYYSHSDYYGNNCTYDVFAGGPGAGVAQIAGNYLLDNNGTIWRAILY